MICFSKQLNYILSRGGKITFALVYPKRWVVNICIDY